MRLHRPKMPGDLAQPAARGDELRTEVGTIISPDSGPLQDSDITHYIDFAILSIADPVPNPSSYPNCLLVVHHSAPYTK